MFSNNEESSKSELDGINLHSVSNNLADIKGELMDVRRGLQVIPSSDINNDSSRDHIPIEEIENLTETFQNKETELLSSRSDNISSEGHLELNDYNQHSQSCEDDREIAIETVDNSETSLNLNTNHYYDNLSAAPIMVYQMPCGNFVPFDSLVSVPIAKTGESKTNESIDLLSNHYSSQEILINSQNTYANTQPHFLLPENIKYKGQLNDKMFVSQIPVYSSDDSANLFLDTRQSLVRNNRCELNLGEPVNTDMNLGTDVGFHTNPTVTSDPNVHHLATCFTSTTDSEVALTLASLGNVKSDKMQQNLSGNLPFTFENISKPVDDKVIFPTSVESENKFNSCVSDENEFPHHSSSNSLHIDINSGDLQLKHNTHKIKINDNSGLKSITKAKGFGKTSRSKVQNISKRTLQSNSSDVIRSQNSLKEEKESHDPRKKNLLGQLLKASKQCEPASLIPEGVVDDVIPAVGYRIMDVSNLSEMIRMMHRCSNTSSKALIVVQEQASLREGAVSQLSVICTGCKEGAVCATSSKSPDNGFDINARVEMLKKEFNIEESQFQKMLEILGIFYRIKPPVEERIETKDIHQEEPEKKRKKVVKNHQKLECKICHKVVSGKNYLKIHMLMHDNMLHTCPYCQAYFKRVFNLREHIKKHENVKFECNSCHKRYSDRSTLLAHIKSIHLAEYRLECEICSKRFFHKAHFEAHLRVHTKEKPFSCDVCGKHYAHMTTVKKHMQSHVTGTKYKCRLCGKLYRAQFGIRQHLMQQHKVKKSDIEAQVITDVIAEVCPPPSAPVVSSKQHTNDAKNSQRLDENIDNEDSPEELENLNKEYFQNIPVSSGSTVVSFHSSKNQVDSPKILSNWKKPL